jgi:hypothetical protein
MWLQRSGIASLKEGDHNTKYFHHKAAHRAKKNKKKMLRKDDGQTTKNKGEMENMAHEFFKNMFSADVNIAPADLFQAFAPCISD